MISVYTDVSCMVVEFGDEYVISIPSGYSIPISNVRVRKGIVYFNANGGEDFLSIVYTVLGEDPFYIPAKYDIIFDLHNKGVITEIHQASFK